MPRNLLSRGDLHRNRAGHGIVAGRRGGARSEVNGGARRRDVDSDGIALRHALVVKGRVDGGNDAEGFLRDLLGRAEKSRREGSKRVSHSVLVSLRLSAGLLRESETRLRHLRSAFL